MLFFFFKWLYYYYYDYHRYIEIGLTKQRKLSHLLDAKMLRETKEELGVS